MDTSWTEYVLGPFFNATIQLLMSIPQLIKHFFKERKKEPQPPISSFYWLLLLIIDMVLARIPSFKKKKGLGIILVNRLGDAVLALPTLKVLQERYGEDIEIIGDNSWKVLKDNLYHEFTIHFIQEKEYRENFIYRFKTNRYIKSRNWKTCISFFHHSSITREGYMLQVSGASEKIVAAIPPYITESRKHNWLFSVTDALADQYIPSSEETYQLSFKGREMTAQMHVLDRLNQFTAQLFNTTIPFTYPSIPLFAHEVASLKGKKYVILNFGASQVGRSWPLTNWVLLAQLLNNWGYMAVFSGGPDEVKYQAELEKLLSLYQVASTQTVLLINKIDFSALMGVFQQARLYIGPDTGTTHLAIALGLKSIVLFANNIPARFGDYFPYPDTYLKTDCHLEVFNEKEMRNILSAQELVESALFGVVAEYLELRQSVLITTNQMNTGR